MGFLSRSQQQKQTLKMYSAGFLYIFIWWQTRWERGGGGGKSIAKQYSISFPKVKVFQRVSTTLWLSFLESIRLLVSFYCQDNVYNEFLYYFVIATTATVADIVIGRTSKHTTQIYFFASTLSLILTNFLRIVSYRLKNGWTYWVK